MKKCGIYEIKNKENGKVYIGQTHNMKERFQRHRYKLRSNKHYNKHLQNSWNKYGEQSFEFMFLEGCDIKQLTAAEQKWIDKHPPSQLYNRILDTSLQAESNPFFGKKHTIETKIKMSKAKQGMYKGANNPNWGRRQNKAKCINTGKSVKLNKEKVLKIAQLLKEGIPHQKIANQYNIARTAITRISNGARWSHVTGGPIIPVVYKNGKRVLSDNHIKNKAKGGKLCR